MCLHISAYTHFCDTSTQFHALVPWDSSFRTFRQLLNGPLSSNVSTVKNEKIISQIIPLRMKIAQGKWKWSRGRKRRSTVFPKDILLQRITLNVPLEQEGVEGEEAVKRVGVGGHTVSPCRAAHHRQHGAVIPLYDGVAEHHLVLPATKTYQLLRFQTFLVCRKFPL